MNILFNDGTTLEGEIVCQALFVVIIKAGNMYYLASKDAIVEPDLFKHEEQ